jgi:hypothetical protein
MSDHKKWKIHHGVTPRKEEEDAISTKNSVQLRVSFFVVGCINVLSRDNLLRAVIKRTGKPPGIAGRFLMCARYGK